jgi:hypothetical protein
LIPAPTDALGARLFELAGTSLRIVCGCCTTSGFYPVDAMAAAHGGGLAVRDVLRRLRCTVCGTRPPASVELVEWMETGDGGPALGWSVELLPALWPEPEGGPE